MPNLQISPRIKVDIKVVVWIREFLLGRTQRVRVGGQLSDEVRVTSGVPQGSVLGPLLFLAYVNDIWKNMESTIRLFADDCVIYRKIINNEDMEKLQKDLDRLGEWVAENAMKINPSKSKAIRLTRATHGTHTLSTSGTQTQNRKLLLVCGRHFTNIRLQPHQHTDNP